MFGELQPEIEEYFAHCWSYPSGRDVKPKPDLSPSSLTSPGMDDYENGEQDNDEDEHHDREAASEGRRSFARRGGRVVC